MSEKEGVQIITRIRALVFKKYDFGEFILKLITLSASFKAS